MSARLRGLGLVLNVMRGLSVMTTTSNFYSGPKSTHISSCRGRPLCLPSRTGDHRGSPLRLLPKLKHHRNCNFFSAFERLDQFERLSLRSARNEGFVTLCVLCVPSMK